MPGAGRTPVTAVPSDVSAGEFSTWLSGLRSALDGDADSDVPCDDCTACCTASHFVHVAPDEVATLDRIPSELLFPAPGRPPGHVLLGYDEQGHCPMLVDNACSIYEHRPRTCRTYDCRVLEAAGVELEDPTKEAVARRAARWRFSYASAADRVRHDAVRAAARFVGERANDVLDRLAPTDPTQVAVLAVEIHEVFLRNGDESNLVLVDDPDPDEVRVAVTSRVGRNSGPARSLPLS